jgi:DNA polymerase I-like protein with 3'-5' exonuclease and polymerase domains
MLVVEFANLNLFLNWIAEREKIRIAKESGAAPPWTYDEILREGSFCNVCREHDRTTVWIKQKWREPHRDDPHVWFLMAVARLINAPEVLGAIAVPLPWDKPRFLDEMRARKAQGLSLERAAYIIPAGRGYPNKFEFLAERIFDPLWAARETVCPKLGDTCRAFFGRLRAFDYLGAFLAAQIVADTKFVGPLAAASDWWDFVAPGPGSERGLNVAAGRDPQTPWTEDAWHATFKQLRIAITPGLEKLGLRLSAQDLQNVLCEGFKYWRAKTAGQLPRRHYRPDGEAPARRTRKTEKPTAPPTPTEAPAPSPQPVIEPVAPVAGVRHAKFFYLARKYVVPAPAQALAGLRLIFDLEADGLLDEATKVHSIVVGNLDNDQIDEYGPERIDDALAHLERATCLVGHNIAAYDLPVLQRLHGWTPALGVTVVDTLVCSRLILSHLEDLDDQATAMGDPPMGKAAGGKLLRGSHSLEAWATRFGASKVGAEIGDWSQWTPLIQARCVNDLSLNKELWKFLQPDGYAKRAMQLERRAAIVCNHIERDGVPFDRVAAEQLYAEWEKKRDALAAQLRQQLPGTKPTSRLQIGKLLESKGWVPERRTEKTKQPVIDDELLEALPVIYPEFAGIAEHDLLRRRIAQLAKGKQAWLRHVGDDGRIHGGLVHIGTPHSRAKHMTPNLAQTPNAKKGASYATECRALFRAPRGWVFVCCDQANLQDRTFAYYLAAFDEGAYAREFVAGVDQHWRSAAALDLISAETERDKGNKIHTAIREGSKRFRYAFLFGAGNEKAGRIIHDTARAVDQLDSSSRLVEKFFGGVHPNEAALVRVGKQARAKFIAAIPGLQRLRAELEQQVEARGWLLGLDNRRVPVRAKYSALNYQVTSAEAIICKRWLTETYAELATRFAYGWDGDVVVCLWVHDEVAVCCKAEVAEQVVEILVRHAKEAGAFYQLKVPLDAECKIGSNWAGDPIAMVATVDPAPPLVSITNAGLPWDDIAEVEALFPAGDTHPNNRLARTLRLTPTTPIVRQTTRQTPNNPSTQVPPSSSNAGNGYDAQLANKICCPFHEDATPSLQIYNGENDPHYHCFGCGAHGPLSDLPEKLMAAAPSARVQADDAEVLAYAHSLWAQAQPIRGTLAAQYLADTRGIKIDALYSDRELALRFHPRCPFDRERHPSLIALFRDIETDEPAGIHRIALTPDAQKIDRRMLGRWSRPRAVKLWPLCRLEAGPKPLYLGEGIETVLAAATRLWDRNRGRPMWPAWAAGSSGNIKKFPIVVGVDELVLLVDRDASGEDAAAHCFRAWKATGKQVRCLRTQAPMHNDFNDLVLAQLRGSP